MENTSMLRRLALGLAVVAVALASCGGAQNAPALTDPKVILADAVTSLKTAKTVHLKVDLSGKVDPTLIFAALGAMGGGSGLGGLPGLGGLGGLPGLGGSGGSGGGATASGAPVALLDLTGSNVEGDVDFAGSATRLSATFPQLFGVTADLIVTGGSAYARSSILSQKYTRVGLGSLFGGSAGSASPEPSAVSTDTVGSLADALDAALAQLPTPPVKLADENVGGQDCYHVQVQVAAGDLPLPSGAQTFASGTTTVDVWTRKLDYRPARVAVALGGGASGNPTITITFSSWDASVTIQAPPPAEVSDQGQGPVALPTP